MAGTKMSIIIRKQNVSWWLGNEFWFKLSSVEHTVTAAASPPAAAGAGPPTAAAAGPPAAAAAGSCLATAAAGPPAAAAAGPGRAAAGPPAAAAAGPGRAAAGPVNMKKCVPRLLLQCIESVTQLHEMSTSYGYQISNISDMQLT